MERTIRIGEETEIRLSNNTGWLLEYRDQFGVDIVPSLVPVLNALVEIYGEIAKQSGELKNAADLFKFVDVSTLQSAVIELSGLQVTDLINITWAMAKAADEDIEEPRRWVRSLETFPVDVIAPAVFELAVRGLVSTKNSQRLLDALKVAGPGKKTKK